MKKKSLFILINFLFVIGVQAQELEMSQLLTMQNKSVMVNFQEQENENFEEKLSSLLQNYEAKKNAKQKKISQRIETHNVQIILYGGYNFHIADYIDGTRVITCLDGNEQGLQGVSVNGIAQAESRDVEWHNEYYIHVYAAGRIISYVNKQIIELF